MGNTCYMSCVLQAFVHNPRLQTFFLFETHECQCQCCNTAFLAQQEGGVCLTQEVKNLFTVCLGHQNGHGGCPVVPHSMLYTTWRLIGQMAGYGQQDAHELLLFLLDGLSHCGLTDEVFRGTLCSDIVHNQCFAYARMRVYCTLRTGLWNLRCHQLSQGDIFGLEPRC